THSPVFKTMFYGDFAEKNKNEIELNDVIRQEFIELLRMIYPFGRRISWDTLDILLKVGDRFQMEWVTQSAEMFIIASRLPIVKKLMYANEYRLHAVQEHCISKLKTARNVKDVEESPFYNDLSEDIKTAIFERKSEIANQSWWDMD
ncbi:hypothetical protein PMAYCL1PPCAC_25213, partial [Pristionchus mayeri]